MKTFTISWIRTERNRYESEIHAESIDDLKTMLKDVGEQVLFERGSPSEEEMIYGHNEGVFKVISQQEDDGPPQCFDKPIIIQS